jgi:hypothetical protein
LPVFLFVPSGRLARRNRSALARWPIDA